MPVAIGDELKLENNRVNAYYDNLFRKLNVAKAWTNTQTTESGGTVTVLKDNGTVLTNIECGYDDWFIPYPVWNNVDVLCVIAGKLYRYYNGQINQVGNKTDWKYCDGVYAAASNYNVVCIDKSSNMYIIQQLTPSGTYNSMFQIGEGISWSFLREKFLAIGDGKLYKFPLESYITTYPMVQVGNVEGWQKIVGCNNGDTYLGLCNGYIYKIIQTYGTYYRDVSYEIISDKNDFVDVCFGHQYGLALDYNNKLYRIYVSSSSSSIEKVPFFENKNVKQFSATFSSSYASVVTTDGDLYYSNNYGTSNNWIKINFDNNWSYTLSSNSNAFILAIGDGKLYKTDGSSITQIGTSSGYKKILGSAESSYDRCISLAWTGNATHTETTVYTTQNPIANDKAYSDTNLTEYSTVQSCTGTTLTDNFRTYEADISKNSSFTAIPPATIHETVKAIDILRATE